MERIIGGEHSLYPTVRLDRQPGMPAAPPRRLAHLCWQQSDHHPGTLFHSKHLSSGSLYHLLELLQIAGALHHKAIHLLRFAMGRSRDRAGSEHRLPQQPEKGHREKERKKTMRQSPGAGLRTVSDRMAGIHGWTPHNSNTDMTGTGRMSSAAGQSGVEKVTGRMSCDYSNCIVCSFVFLYWSPPHVGSGPYGFRVGRSTQTAAVDHRLPPSRRAVLFPLSPLQSTEIAVNRKGPQPQRGWGPFLEPSVLERRSKAGRSSPVRRAKDVYDGAAGMWLQFRLSGAVL